MAMQVYMYMYLGRVQSANTLLNGSAPLASDGLIRGLDQVLLAIVSLELQYPLCRVK